MQVSVARLPAGPILQPRHDRPHGCGSDRVFRQGWWCPQIPLCAFHHLTVIHHWAWTLRLNPDGTTTATSPDGRRTYHSHGPPAHAA